MHGNLAYAVKKPAPIPNQGVSVFRHHCVRNGVWERYNYAGETLTQALPPFLARSPTILLASKFHTPRIPIVFPSPDYFKPFTFSPSTRPFFFYIFFSLPSSPSWCDKNHSLCDTLIFHKTIWWTFFFFQLHLSNTPLPAISVIFGRTFDKSRSFYVVGSKDTRADVPVDWRGKYSISIYFFHLG